MNEEELIEWLKEYKLNVMSLMRIGDYEQGQIDAINNILNKIKKAK